MKVSAAEMEVYLQYSIVLNIVTVYSLQLENSGGPVSAAVMCQLWWQVVTYRTQLRCTVGNLQVVEN